MEKDNHLFSGKFDDYFSRLLVLSVDCRCLLSRAEIERKMEGAVTSAAPPPTEHARRMLMSESVVWFMFEILACDVHSEYSFGVWAFFSWFRCSSVRVCECACVWRGRGPSEQAGWKASQVLRTQNAPAACAHTEVIDFGCRAPPPLSGLTSGTARTWTIPPNHAGSRVIPSLLPVPGCMSVCL